MSYNDTLRRKKEVHELMGLAKQAQTLAKSCSITSLQELEDTENRLGNILPSIYKFLLIKYEYTGVRVSHVLLNVVQCHSIKEVEELVSGYPYKDYFIVWYCIKQAISAIRDTMENYKHVYVHAETVDNLLNTVNELIDIQEWNRNTKQSKTLNDIAVLLTQIKEQF